MESPQDRSQEEENETTILKKLLILEEKTEKDLTFLYLWRTENSSEIAASDEIFKIPFPAIE